MEASPNKQPGYNFDATVFKRRLKRLYNAYLWKSCEGFVTVYYTGSGSAPSSTSKSSAFNTWLLGNRYPGTVMVFSKKQIDFLCAEARKVDFRDVERCAKEADLKFVVHVENGVQDRLRRLRDILISSGLSRLGYIASESTVSENSKAFIRTLKSPSLELTDITVGIAALLAVKETGDIENVRTAAFITTSAMLKSAMLKIWQAIDENVILSCSELAFETQKALLDPTRYDPRLKAENVKLSHPPKFQNGRNNDNLLCYDAGSVIICSLASSYNMYCANVARTILIDPDLKQTKAYKVLLEAHEAAIGASKPGNKASDVYSAALAVVGKEAPELTPNLTKSAGTVIVTGLCEPVLILDETIAIILIAGMVLNVSLGFQNLPEAKSSGYALELADTVIVTSAGNEVMTSKATKAFKDVANLFIEGGEEEEERVQSSEYLDSGATSQKEQRRKDQAQLLLSVNKKTIEYLRSNDLIACDPLNMVDQLNTSSSRHMDPLIQVDHENKLVILPIDGHMVSFHISVVKEVSTYRLTQGIYLIRIIFKVSGGLPLSQTDIFLKAVSFHSKARGHLADVAEHIKRLLLLQDVSSSDRYEESAKNNLEGKDSSETKESCVIKIKFSRLCVSPPFRTGDECLETCIVADDDSLSYACSAGAVIISLSNIKHAIFQEAREGMTILLHFHLHCPIMVGEVNTKDVQFYMKLTDENDHENTRKKFGSFVDLVHHIKLEKPLMFGFHGVFDTTSAFIVSTPSCIAQLTETPYHVVTLSEIIIVNLERVGVGQETFDMVMVSNDLKNFDRIKSIPSGSLEEIEEWLNRINIKYFETKISVNWKTLLNSVTSDPENFISGGVWECLML